MKSVQIKVQANQQLMRGKVAQTAARIKLNRRSFPQPPTSGCPLVRVKPAQKPKKIGLDGHATIPYLADSKELLFAHPSFKLLSHSLWECKYHIVFCPKYRYRVMGGEVGSYKEKEPP